MKKTLEQLHLDAKRFEKEATNYRTSAKHRHFYRTLLNDTLKEITEREAETKAL